jgi:hypothetical protein
MRSTYLLGAALAALIAAPAMAQTSGSTGTSHSGATHSGASKAPPASTSTPPSSSSTGSSSTGAMGSTGATGTTSGTMGGAMSGSMSSQTGAAADASATASALAVGLAVKDNTGATIGSITSLKPEASGKQTATIKMGADTFAVDSASLAVQGDAAVINASQAELKSMLAQRGK